MTAPSIEGIVWTGQVNFTDSSDVGTTGTATLTLTPNIGMTNLPALVNGLPGMPSDFRNVIVNQVTAGTTPPPSFLTLVTEGGPGVASVYDLTIFVNAGATGPATPFALSNATDLTGALTDKFVPVYSTTDHLWHVSPMLAGDIISVTPVTGFTAFAGSGAQATLASLTIPSQPFAWRPDVGGYGLAQLGTANTRVDFFAYLNSPTTGDQVGYGRGVAGNLPPMVPLNRAFGAPTGATLPYGVVPAGQQGVLFFVAKQMNSTADGWGVAAADLAFSVKVNPIP